MPAAWLSNVLTRQCSEVWRFRVRLAERRQCNYVLVKVCCCGSPAGFGRLASLIAALVTSFFVA